MVEIIRNVADLRLLAAKWNAVAEPFRTPLLRHEWFTACAEAFCPPDRLAIVVVGSRDEIHAAAPMVLTRRRGLEQLELLGASFLGESSGFIYTDEEALRKLLEVVIGMGKPIFLSRLRSDSPEISALRQVCRGRGLLESSDAPGSPWIPIATSWAAFEAGISSSRRSSFRRARRQAEGFGEVQFEVLSPPPDRLEKHLEEVFLVEAASWKGRIGTALLSSPPLKRFFSLYSKTAARLAMLRLCSLRINGKAVAVQLAVEYANRFWILKVGYDEALARCSPGMLLMHETIRRAFEQGLEAYEFLGTDESWIRVWTDQVHSHVSSRIYPFSLRGMLGLGIDVSRFVLGKTMAIGRKTHGLLGEAT